MQYAERKKELIENETIKHYSSFKQKLKEEGLRFKEIETILKSFYKEDEKPLRQLLDARRKQNKKINNRVLFYQSCGNYDIWFFTFTYDDAKRRKEMTAETLKRYVIKALQDADDYIVNVDYGDETGRLHYHAIVIYNKKNGAGHFMKGKEAAKVFDDEIYKEIKNNKLYVNIGNKALMEYENKVGNIYIEKYGGTKKDKDKMVMYMSKITQHSIKVKQKYISVKKGTIYNAYQDLMKKAKELNKKDNEEYGKYTPLINTILSTPYLKKELEKVDPFYRQQEIRY